MELNKLPIYDMSDNPTGCCPRFKPAGWDQQELHFKEKLFVRVETRNILHVPVNIGKVFSKTFEAIEKADAYDKEQFVVLTNDISAWKAEHFFAVTKEVSGEEMVRMSGDFLTRVFEGPYKEAPKWYEQMKKYVQQQGKTAKKVYFFYTTCPNCAKYYGKNYVVGFAEAA